jgi:hypothetical protein
VSAKVLGKETLNPSFSRASWHSHHNKLWLLWCNCRCNSWLVLAMPILLYLFAHSYRALSHCLAINSFVNTLSVHLEKIV